MALIVDPDDLGYVLTSATTAELTIDTTAKEIGLNLQGNLSADGVDSTALFSRLIDLFRIDDIFGKEDFPVFCIDKDAGKFIIGYDGANYNEWTFRDDATRKLLRNGGWQEYDNTGILQQEGIGITTLGNIDATDKNNGDKGYYRFSSQSASTEFTYAGAVNELIPSYKNGQFDYRTDMLSIFVREAGKVYGQSSTVDIGIAQGSVLAPLKNTFLLAESDDSNISFNDTQIENDAPFTGMSITWKDTPDTITIGGTDYDFHVEIDGNGGTPAEIYAYVQYQLRQTSDIDAGAGTQIGNLTSELIEYDGSIIKTKVVPEGGVYISNYDAAYQNSLRFTDDTGAVISYPYYPTLSLTFGNNAVVDPLAECRCYINTNYPGASAVLLQDKDGADINFAISGQANHTFQIDFDNNTQDGRTDMSAPIDVTFVVVGASTASNVAVPFSITRTDILPVSITPALQRNYINT
jgi:hypothetical protein